MPHIATTLERIQHWDERICIRLNRAVRAPPLLAAMRALSWLGNGVFWYALLLALLVPFTLLVAASRVVLGLHYPSDVIAGAALGAVIAMLSFNL